MAIWYKLDRWAKDIDDAAKEVTRSTDKTVWFKTRTGRETSERRQSNYHNWYESREDAVKEICARIQSERDAKYKKQLSSAAPALLEALEGLMELESRGRIMPIGEEWDKARAAIAAARGDS